MRNLLICFILLVNIMFSFPIEHVAAEEEKVLTEKTISGETAILIDGTTGKVLFQKQPDVPMYPASITKIATGIYAITKGKPDDIVTVSKRARNEEGTRVYLAEGEQVPLRNLEFGLLMNSGNDAATAIAEHLDGSNEAFGEKLTAFLKEKVGVTKTNFTNPHGLHDPNHYTTASDMAKIAQFAMKNELFREIVATKTLPWKGKEWDTVIVNHNKMLWRYEGATGIKNGFTDQARNTLVVSAKRGTTELIAVTMKSTSSAFAYKDVTNMLDYGFAHFETRQVAKAGENYIFSTTTISERQDVFYTEKDLFMTMPLYSGYTQQIQMEGNLQITLTNGETELFPLKRKELPGVTSQNGFMSPSKAATPVFPRYVIFVCWLALNMFLVFVFIRLKNRQKMMQRKNRQLL